MRRNVLVRVGFRIVKMRTDNNQRNELEYLMSRIYFFSAVFFRTIDLMFTIRNACCVWKFGLRNSFVDAIAILRIHHAYLKLKIKS